MSKRKANLARSSSVSLNKQRRTMFYSFSLILLPQVVLSQFGLLGEFYEQPDLSDLPCNKSIEDFMLGQVPTLTEVINSINVNKLQPTRCSWVEVERKNNYPSVEYPSVPDAEFDLGLERNIRDGQYYITRIFDPKDEPFGTPNRNRIGYAKNVQLRKGYRLISVNGDTTEFLLRDKILSPNAFLQTDPIFYKFQTFKLEYYCSGIITFQGNFVGHLSGTMSIQNEGLYTFEFSSTVAQVNFLMGHDHCNGGDVYGYNDASCGARAEIENLRFKDLPRHASGISGHDCRLDGAKDALCQDVDYTTRFPSKEICFNTANGCEPFQTWGMQIPDIKCRPAADRTIRRTRWLRAGKHPVKLNIARRFRQADYAPLGLSLKYKGPDTTPEKIIKGANMFNCTGANGLYLPKETSTTQFQKGPSLEKIEWKLRLRSGKWQVINTKHAPNCFNRGTPLNEGEDNLDHLAFEYKWIGFVPGGALIDYPQRQVVHDVNGKVVQADLVMGKDMEFFGNLDADKQTINLEVFHDWKELSIPSYVMNPLQEPKWAAEWWGPIPDDFEFTLKDVNGMTRRQEKYEYAFNQGPFNEDVTVPRPEFEVVQGARRRLGEEDNLDDKRQAGRRFQEQKQDEYRRKRAKRLLRRKQGGRNYRAKKKGLMSILSDAVESIENKDENVVVVETDAQGSIRTQVRKLSVFRDGDKTYSIPKTLDLYLSATKQEGPFAEIRRYTEEEYATLLELEKNEKLQQELAREYHRRISEASTNGRKTDGNQSKRKQSEGKESEEKSSEKKSDTPGLVAKEKRNLRSLREASFVKDAAEDATAGQEESTYTNRESFPIQEEQPEAAPRSLSVTKPPGLTLPHYGRSYHDAIFFTTPFHPQIVVDGNPVPFFEPWPNELPGSTQKSQTTEAKYPIPLPAFQPMKPFTVRFTGLLQVIKAGKYKFWLQTDASFVMLFGGRGRGAEVVLQNVNVVLIPQEYETPYYDLLVGEHYIRLDMIMRNSNKFIWLSYEGPDTIDHETQMKPFRNLQYSQPSIYGGMTYRREVMNLESRNSPTLKTLQSYDTVCRLLVSRQGGVSVSRDCANTCIDSTLINTLSTGVHADGICDSPTYGSYNMFCPEWFFDGGDCDPASSAREEDPTIECYVTPPSGDYKRFGYTQCERTEKIGYNVYYDLDGNRKKDENAPDPSVNPNLRGTEETYCISDRDIFPSLPTYEYIHWPFTTTTTPVPFGYREKPRVAYAVCCVSKIKNDPEYGEYCMAFGSPRSCFDENLIVLNRRKAWLRDSAEYAEEDLKNYYLANGDMEIQTIVDCKTDLCNPLPETVFQASSGEMIYVCPWNKEQHEIDALYMAIPFKETLTCYDVVEKSKFPPYKCDKRHYSSWNYCQNDRTWEGRYFDNCCVTTYVDVETNDFVCKLTGLPKNYPGKCDGYLQRRIAPLNAVQTLARQPRIWSQCDHSDLCNDPASFGCFVEVNNEEKIKQEVIAVTRPKEVEIDYPPAGDDYSPLVLGVAMACILLFIVGPIAGYFVTKQRKERRSNQFAGDIEINQQKEELAKGVTPWYGRIKPGGALFGKFHVKYKPKDLTYEQEMELKKKEAMGERAFYEEKYIGHVRGHAAEVAGGPSDDGLDDYTREMLAEMRRKEAEEAQEASLKLAIAAQERKAMDPKNAFIKGARPAHFENATEYRRTHGMADAPSYTNQVEPQLMLEDGSGYSPNIRAKQLAALGTDLDATLAIRKDENRKRVVPTMDMTLKPEEVAEIAQTVAEQRVERFNHDAIVDELPYDPGAAMQAQDMLTRLDLNSEIQQSRRREANAEMQILERFDAEMGGNLKLRRTQLLDVGAPQAQDMRVPEQIDSRRDVLYPQQQQHRGRGHPARSDGHHPHNTQHIHDMGYYQEDQISMATTAVAPAQVMPAAMARAIRKKKLKGKAVT